MVWKSFKDKQSKKNLNLQLAAKTVNQSAIKQKPKFFIKNIRAKLTLNQKKMSRVKSILASKSKKKPKYLRSRRFIKDGTRIEYTRPYNKNPTLNRRIKRLKYQNKKLLPFVLYYNSKNWARSYVQRRKHWSVLSPSIKWKFDKKNYHKKNILYKKYRSHLVRFIYKKHFRLNSLLFRSYWIVKFISNLIKKGKKINSYSVVLNILFRLKIVYGRSPILILFELFEIYRMPLVGIPPRSKTRKSIARVHLASWWKQYSIVIRLLATSLKPNYRVTASWKGKALAILLSTIANPNDSQISKRVYLNTQLITYGRVHLHFRWHKASRRAKRLFI